MLVAALVEPAGLARLALWRGYWVRRKTLTNFKINLSPWICYYSYQVLQQNTANDLVDDTMSTLVTTSLGDGRGFLFSLFLNLLLGLSNKTTPTTTMTTFDAISPGDGIFLVVISPFLITNLTICFLILSETWRRWRFDFTLHRTDCDGSMNCVVDKQKCWFIDSGCW